MPTKKLRNFLRIFGLSALAVAGTTLSASAAIDQSQCSDLGGLSLGGATVTETRWVTVGETSACVVHAHRAPFLDIEVTLPAVWSERFFLQGGSGFDGNIKSSLTRDDAGKVTALHPAITELGVARASSNGGNRAGVEGQSSPGVWLSGTPEGAASLRDYAFQGLGTTIHFSKALVETAYGQPASHSYFVGCSNGGRNAYAVAERWPEEFDGISAGCEGMAMGGQVAQWIALANTIGTDAALTKEQYSAAYAAAVEECDGKDGTNDGIISQPSQCVFDPATLACSVSDAETCLSEPQVGTLKMLYGDFRDAQGNVVYSGYPPADFGGWVNFHGVLGGGFAWMSTGNPEWFTSAEKKASFDIATDLYRIESGLLHKGYDHDRVAIATYVASGGKLISWHAVGDGLLSANDHLRNFLSMAKQAEMIAAAEGARGPASDNARFFMVPGGDHGDGYGPSNIDLVSALINWAENAKAPDSLMIKRGDITLPACAYPKVTKGAGSGYVCD